MIIAIDGPAASGKSTSAKLLAKELGYLYLDTGAMYRCIAFSILENKIDISNQDSLTKFLKNFEIDLKKTNNNLSFFVNGKNVTNKIRKSDVSQKVSEVSAIPIIREYMVRIQRSFTKNNSCVMEGRDIGTVVFLMQNLNFFLLAAMKLGQKGDSLSLNL